MDNDFIDLQIRETFKLFCGERSETDDIELYRLIYDQLLGETYRFLQDNLDLGRQALLIREITRVRREETDKDKQGEKIWDLVFGFMTAIPDVRLRLEKRLLCFIGYLYLEAQKNGR